MRAGRCGGSFVRMGGPRQRFERMLWASRWVMVLGVVVCALMALAVFYLALLDALQLPGYLAHYSTAGLVGEARADLRNQVLLTIVKSLDGFLIAAILLIFALGLYELFIGPLSPARSSQVGLRLLHVEGLDDLKRRIANLLLLVLIIEFFQRALRLEYPSANDLLRLAVGILLIGLTLFLGRLRPGGGEHH